MQVQFLAALGAQQGLTKAPCKPFPEETGGRYVFVDSAEALNEVYRALSRSVAWCWSRDEATALLALVASLVLVLSVGVSEARQQVL